MPGILVLGICFLLFLSINYEEVGWIRSLHDNFDEDGGNNCGVNNFHGIKTWTIRFQDDDIKVGIMLPQRNNFLRYLLCFVVVGSDHHRHGPAPPLPPSTLPTPLSPLCLACPPHRRSSYSVATPACPVSVRRPRRSRPPTPSSFVIPIVVPIHPRDVPHPRRHSRCYLSPPAASATSRFPIIRRYAFNMHLILDWHELL